MDERGDCLSLEDVQKFESHMQAGTHVALSSRPVVFTLAGNFRNFHILRALGNCSGDTPRTGLPISMRKSNIY